MTARFTGAVLTGGASRRMGRDKALLRVGSRPPLAEVARRALEEAGAAEVLAVGGDAGALSALGLRPVPDEHPGEGPLGGLLTALDAATTDEVVVLTCDLPDVDGPAVAALLAGLRADPAVDVALPHVDGRDLPLTAAWRATRARRVLRAAFDAGERAPRRVLDRLTVRRVPEASRPRRSATSTVPRTSTGTLARSPHRSTHRRAPVADAAPLEPHQLRPRTADVGIDPRPERG